MFRIDLRPGDVCRGGSRVDINLWQFIYDPNNEHNL